MLFPSGTTAFPCENALFVFRSLQQLAESAFYDSRTQLLNAIARTSALITASIDRIFSNDVAIAFSDSLFAFSLAPSEPTQPFSLALLAPLVF
jgi:hypothetical protein